MNAKELLEMKIKMLESIDLSNENNVKNTFDKMDPKSIIIEDYLSEQPEDTTNNDKEQNGPKKLGE